MGPTSGTRRFVRENCRGALTGLNVQTLVQNYKCLRVAVIICVTVVKLVNTQTRKFTDTQTDRQTDSFWPAILLAQPVETTIQASVMAHGVNILDTPGPPVSDTSRITLRHCGVWLCRSWHLVTSPISQVWYLWISTRMAGTVCPRRATTGRTILQGAHVCQASVAFRCPATVQLGPLSTTTDTGPKPECTVPHR